MKTMLSVLTLCLALTRPALAWVDGPSMTVEEKRTREMAAILMYKTQAKERKAQAKEHNVAALTAIIGTLHTRLEDPVFKCASRESLIDGLSKIGSNIMFAADGAASCVQNQRHSSLDVTADIVGTILTPGDLGSLSKNIFTFKLTIKRNGEREFHNRWAYQADELSDMGDEIGEALNRVKQNLQREKLEKIMNQAEAMSEQL